MPLPRAVELIRVSSAGQAERDSPEDQRRALDALRRSRPATIIERIELGASGLSGALPVAKRPDLQRLRHMAEHGGFEELRVRHFDRLCRIDDPDEQEAVFSILRRAGAVLVEADGGVTDPRSLPGRIVAIVKAEGAAEERRKIIERTVAARRRLSAEGRPMTTVPYARRYDFAAGEWSTDPRELATYRRIFRDVIAGVSLHQLAARLNAEGIAAPRGGAWEASSLQRMVRNPGAVGRMTSYGHPIACPQVVDDVTQRRALAALARGRTRSGPPAKHRALLRKVATCSECGATMHVVVGGRKGATALYYRCARAKGRPGQPATCAATTHHPVEAIDAGFLDALKATIRNPDLLRRASEPGPKAGHAVEELAAVRRELERLDRREENLVRMRSQGEVRDEVWRRQTAEIGRLRAGAEERRDALAEQVAAAERTREQIADVRHAVEGIRRRLARATWAHWRAIVVGAWPRQEGVWVRIHPNGRVEPHGGLLRLGGRLSSRTSASPQIAITLGALQAR